MFQLAIFDTDLTESVSILYYSLGESKRVFNTLNYNNVIRNEKYQFYWLINQNCANKIKFAWSTSTCSPLKSTTKTVAVEPCKQN